MAQRLISERLKGQDAQKAREALSKLQEAGFPLHFDVRVAKIALFAVIGAIIGGALPGHRWVAGAMIGLFIGLGRKAKS